MNNRDGMSNSSFESQENPSTLSLRSTFLGLSWVFGINSEVPILNVTNKTRKAIFFTASNAGVVQDVDTMEQMLLQGHANTISASCISTDKRWIATGDIGENCMIVVWDIDKGIPIQTLFDIDGSGVAAMAFSKDSRMLASLSSSLPQILSIWDWTSQNETPLCSLTLNQEFGIQTFITFSTVDRHQLASNNLNQAIFYFLVDKEIHYCAPTLTDKDFNKIVGRYSQSLFHATSERVLTATSCGNIVVWSHFGNGYVCDRKAFKIVKIQEKAITVLTHHLNHIVLGDSEGIVKFLDQDLQLLNWYNNLKSDTPISSISFCSCNSTSKTIESSTQTPSQNYPESATIEGKPFAVHDFAVGFVNSKVVYMKTEGSHLKVLKEDPCYSIDAVATHPKESRLLIGSHDGRLQLWDYYSKQLLTNCCLNGKISCVTFNSTGETIGVGFVSGNVQILDALTLQPDGDDTVFQHCHGEIVKMCFSHNSKYLATADLDRCVTLFKSEMINQDLKWSYVGKHRSHYKKIQDLCFGVSLDDGSPRLLSLGQDRMLVEYDLFNSSTDDLKLLAYDRIEQTDIPMCLSWYPPVVKEDFLMISNDKFKIKLFNSTTKMCRRTTLGPIYDSPIQRMICLPPVKGRIHRYMAYSTTDKIGLMALPLDGNPHKSMALIDHPDGASTICVSHDGNYIFTAGGKDTSVFMWKCNFDVLEASSALGGEGLTPFYGLIDGGRDGKLFAELEDYFYYSQLKHQGIDTMEERQVSTRIPLAEIPSIMRALGFYPTEQQIDEMINEIKFSCYVETGKYVEDIDIGGFLKLYVNHRPVFALSPQDLVKAFNCLGSKDSDGNVCLERSEFLKVLQEKGEHMTEIELGEYMATLLGISDLTGSLESKEFNAKDSADMLENRLPGNITVETFSKTMLGLST